MIFRFSIEVKPEAREDLSSWMAHFERTGMPAGIVIDQHGMLSIWRAGSRKSTYRKDSHDEPAGVLNKSVNGFEQLWVQAGGRIQL